MDELAANLIVVSAPAASLNVALEDVASNAFEPASECEPKATERYALLLACGPKATALFALALANEPNAIASCSMALAV